MQINCSVKCAVFYHKLNKNLLWSPEIGTAVCGGKGWSFYGQSQQQQQQQYRTVRAPPKRERTTSRQPARHKNSVTPAAAEAHLNRNEIIPSSSATKKKAEEKSRKKTFQQTSEQPRAPYRSSSALENQLHRVPVISTHTRARGPLASRPRTARPQC